MTRSMQRVAEAVAGDPAGCARLTVTDVNPAKRALADALGAAEGGAAIGSVLLNMAVFGAMFSYIMQAISFILLRLNQAGSMASPLQTWVTDHPRDGSAWQTLARVWRSQGQEMRALRAEAEAQVAHYDYAAAVDRFKAAQDLARKAGAGADYFEASIIDTRLRAVEELLREQLRDKAINK